MKKTWFIGLPILCLWLLEGCAGRQEAPFRHRVMLTQPVRVGEGSVVSVTGTLQEAHNIGLGFKTPGQIARIVVNEGDHILRGQLIATLDDKDYRLGVEALEIQYKQMKDEVARLKQLYEARSLSANDYEKAVAGLEQLGVQLQTNRNKLDYTRLCAPVDGYVQSVHLSPAEMVNAGTPVIHLLDEHRLEVSAYLPVDLYERRAQIQAVRCRLSSAASSVAVPMKLQGLSPKADGNRLYKARLAFAGSLPARPATGTNVEVEFVLADTASAHRFTLPPRSIFQADGQTYVWILAADSTVRRMPVSVQQLDGGGQALVTSGLTGTEQVVRAGVHALQEGERVEVIPPAAETNVGGLL